MTRPHTLVIGIDPGLSGGFALIDKTGRLVDAANFPTRMVNQRTRLDGPKLAALIAAAKPTHAFVENVSSRPRQAGQFQFGVNTGMVHGILHALDVPVELVAPVSWKSVFGIRREDDQTKRDMKFEARSVAASLYPKQAGLFARVKDDGVAEAALIALYGLSRLAQQ